MRKVERVDLMVKFGTGNYSVRDIACFLRGLFSIGFYRCKPRGSVKR